MAASTKAFCMSCVLDREIDEQTGRCTRCGHQVVEQSTEPKPDRNAGQPARAPSQAYRAAPEVGETARLAEYERRREGISPVAPFDAARSVARVQAESHYAPTPQTKTCTLCGETKPLDKFYANAANRGGLMARCKDCHNGKKPAEPLAEEPALAAVPVVAPEQHAGPAAVPPLPSPSPPDSPLPSAAPAPAPPPPTGTPSAEWLAEAHALADGFEVQARAADDRARAAFALADECQAEAKALRKKASVFVKLLGEIP